MFNEIEIEGLKGVGSVRLSFDSASRVRVLFGKRNSLSHSDQRKPKSALLQLIKGEGQE